MKTRIVMKFGGTSVGSAGRMKEVASIVAARPHQTVVVVSAMAGVTDMLVRASQLADKQQANQLNELLAEVRAKHFHTITELALSEAERRTVTGVIQEMLAALEVAVMRVLNKGHCTKADADQIVSYGERLNIHLVAAALRTSGVAAVPVDATEVIVTSDRHGDAHPFLDESTLKAAMTLVPLLDQQVVPVVTGFIGATASGEVTTLGRGASDYTATILGYCLDAAEVWIWTDVTGVKTADPRLIPEAKTIDSLSYKEAAELSFFGAKVLHPLTMVPASLKEIPIVIKNTFEPTLPGTKITARASGRAVKAVTVKHDVSLVTVRGQGVMGVPRIAAKALGALAENDIEVFMLSQASAEQYLSLVVRTDGSAPAVECIYQALTGDMVAKTVEGISLQTGQAIVAVVGESMQQLPGMTERTFSALGAGGIEVSAIAYGSSDHSLSFVVDAGDAVMALKILHQAFQLVT